MNTVKKMEVMEEQEEELQLNSEWASVRAVFNNDYLREKILDVVLHNKDGSINRKSLLYVRQVDKSWRDTVSHRLNRLKVPLYTVKLDEINSLNGMPFVEANGKALDLFTAFFAARDSETFSLKLCEEFFRLENYDSLSTCLKRCSKGLVQLELVIPENVGSFPSIFPNVCLPNLKGLYVSFTHPENWNRPSNTTTFLATLLLQCTNLKELTISPRSGFEDVCPPDIGYVSLPPTLRNIKLECPMRVEDLQILERNPLPALSELSLTVAGLPLPEEALFNVLSGCKQTLEFVTIRCSDDEPEEDRHALNVVKFPEMQKLERMQLNQFIMGLEEETKENLNKCLPKLKRLDLYVSPNMLAELESTHALATWTEKVSLKAMSSLTLIAVAVQVEATEEIRRDRFLPTPNVMERIMQGMPNVRDVTLTVDGKQPADLVPLFEKLTQISNLSIMLENTDHIENSDVWDALLTGIPLEVTKELRLNPSSEDTFKIEEPASPSIKLLKNLRLVAFSSLEGDSRSGNLLVSRLAFKYGFQQMPALRAVILRHRFKVSSEVSNQWEKSGRFRRICQK